MLWVFVSGALGGLVYSLTTGESHKLRLPRRILKEVPAAAAKTAPNFWDKFKLTIRTTGIDTGFLGHMVIGAVSGFILFSLAVSHLNFDVSGVLGILRFHSSKPMTTTGVLTLIHTFSIASVGGFLGLRLIIKVADETMLQLGRRVEELESESERHQRRTQIQSHLLSARTLIAGQPPDLDGALAEIDKALHIRATKHGEFVKAMILARKLDLKGALAALDRAMPLEPDEIVADNGGVYWNKACYLARIKPTSIQAVIDNLDKALMIRPKARNDIKEDPDFADLVDNPSFKAHFKLS